MLTYFNLNQLFCNATERENKDCSSHINSFFIIWVEFFKFNDG